MSNGIITDNFSTLVNKPQRLVATIATGTADGSTSIPNFDNTNGVFFTYPDSTSSRASDPIYPILSWDNSTKIMSWAFQTHIVRIAKPALAPRWVEQATDKRSVTIYCMMFGGPSPNGFGFIARDPSGNVVVDSSFRSMAFANDFTSSINGPVTSVAYGYYYRRYQTTATADGTHDTYSGPSYYEGNDAGINALVWNSNFKLHGIDVTTNGDPGWIASNGSFSGQVNGYDNHVIAPRTNARVNLPNSGVVIFDENNKLTFSSNDEYIELIDVFSFTNTQNDLANNTVQTMNHSAARSGYHCAYTYISTHPNMYYTEEVPPYVGQPGYQGGANSYHYGLKVVSGTQCRLERAFTQYLPLPHTSRPYFGLTHTGQVNAQVIVWQIPN